MRRAIGAEVLPHLAGLRRVLATAPGAAVTGRSLDDAIDLINKALEALRDIARGVFPPILARTGLGAALRLYARRAGGRVRLTISPSAGTARFASHIEAVTYFCAVETVRELGGAARVDLDVDDGAVLLTVTAVDEGVQLAERGQPVVDRVLACGGSVAVTGENGLAGVQVSMPAQAQPRALDSAQAAASRSGPNADFGM